MRMLNFVLSLSAFIFASDCRPDTTYHTSTQDFYVAKRGVSPDCGNRTNPCPTLYDASWRIDDITYRHVIVHIIDGQNETRLQEIIAYNSTYFHPCTFTLQSLTVAKVTITFNETNIRDLNDWFPQSLCMRDESYFYKYIFEVSSFTQLTILNMIINDYSSHELGIANILLTSDIWDGSITCDNCKVTNIVSSGNISLFSASSFYFTNCLFSDIDANGYIFYAEHYIVDNPIATFRQIIIANSIFTNIVSSSSLIYIMRLRQWIEDEYTILTLMITDTTIEYISTESYVVLDASYAANITFSNVSFSILNGAVYHSEHTIQTNIIMNNVSLYTTAFNDATEALFTFSRKDSTYFYGMYLWYLYDIWHDGWPSCVERDYVYDCDIDCETYVLYQCENPTPFISNNGQLFMYDTHIDNELSHEFLDPWYNDTDPFALYQHDIDFDDTGSFISNTYKLTIEDMYVSRTISYCFIYNDNELSITNAWFNTMHEDIHFNPHALQSYRIVSHLGDSLSSVSVDSCYFTGSEVPLYAHTGSVIIYASTFEYSGRAIEIEESAYVSVQSSAMQYIGKYYGSIYNIGYLSPNVSQAIVILKSTVLEIQDNLISGYDPRGLIYFADNENIYLVNNTVVVSKNNTFFNGSLENIEYPLKIISGADVTLIDNDFTQNSVDPEQSWVHFEDTSVCLTGNTFTNGAIVMDATTVTSCFRSKLLECALFSEIYSNDCNNGYYGEIEPSLFGKKNQFVLNRDVVQVIDAYDSIIALDNINIASNAQVPVNTLFSTLTDTILFLVDSDMNGTHIAYNDNNLYDCNVIFNDRLDDNSQLISRFLIDCNNVTQTMSSSHSVSHASIARISIIAHSRWYFPGQSLRFSYSLSDEMGNSINYEQFSTTFWLQTQSVIVINNTCSLCDRGIELVDVKISGVGRIHSLQITTEDTLILDSKYVNVSIIGCPQGSGPDPNISLCTQCNTDYYSLLANNTQDCISCDPDNNQGVTCSGGSITVSHNNWMGFDAENIISARCPINYCCGDESGCYYDTLSTNTLCATNRNDSSMLCGACIDGYSESLQSTQCVHCTKSLHFERILYPMLLALLWAIALIFLTSDRRKKKKPQERTGIRKYLNNPHFIMMNRILFTRNIIYYQQALSQILSSNPFMAVFVALTQVFNLSVTRNELDSDFAQCFIKGMNGKHKILVDLLMPSMVLLFIVIGHITAIACKQKIPFLFKFRQHNFPKCYAAAFILMIGNILNVLFRLMHCQSIGRYHVHYYFGQEMCFGATWIICLLCLLFIIAVFIAIMVQLKRIGYKQRSNKSYTLNIFVDKYKPQCYWWEIVLLLRRLCIALLSVSFYDSNYRVVFVMVMFVFLGLQSHYEPFLVHSANQMECWLLRCVIIVIVMQNALDINDTFKRVSIILLVLLPFVLMIYYIAVFVRRNKQDDLSVSLLKRRLMFFFFSIIMCYAQGYAPPKISAKSNSNQGIQIVYADDAGGIEMTQKQQKSSHAQKDEELSQDTMSSEDEIDHGSSDDESDFETEDEEAVE